jgi:hypothetical protein
MTDGNALPNLDPPDVTRIKAAAAKRVQAHRARARTGAVGRRRWSRSLLRPGHSFEPPLIWRHGAT